MKSQNEKLFLNIPTLESILLTSNLMISYYLKEKFSHFSDYEKFQTIFHFPKKKLSILRIFTIKFTIRRNVCEIFLVHFSLFILSHLPNFIGKL